MKIPKGHQVIMPYLILNDAKKFIDFVVDVFNAELVFSTMREDNKTLMHSEIQINGSTIMLSGSTEQWKPVKGNLFIYVQDADETYKKAIAAGSATILEPRDENYGRACGVSDPFENVWWITSVK